MEKEGRWDKMIDDLTNRRIDPYSLAEKIINDELNPKSRIPNNR
jgi:hypothetical protein